MQGFPRMFAKALVPLLAWIVPAGVMWSSELLAQDVPVNKNGEEVFGPGYMPDAPLPQAEKLEAGQPLAGIALPADQEMAAASVFSARFGDKADVTLEKALLRKLPFRKGVRRIPLRRPEAGSL